MCVFKKKKEPVTGLVPNFIRAIITHGQANHEMKSPLCTILLYYKVIQNLITSGSAMPELLVLKEHGDKVRR